MDGENTDCCLSSHDSYIYEDNTLTNDIWRWENLALRTNLKNNNNYYAVGAFPKSNKYTKAHFPGVAVLN